MFAERIRRASLAVLAVLLAPGLNPPSPAAPPLEGVQPFGPTAWETAAGEPQPQLQPAPGNPPYVTVVNNGPSSNRVDVVVLGDGYTSSQIETAFAQHVSDLATTMLGQSQEPFARYSNFFNVHRVNVVSNQSGADVPPLGIYRDTALDSTYYWDGATERLLYCNTSKAQSALNAGLAGSGIAADIRLVTVNDSRYGGAGGTWAVYAGANSSATEIALHEQGHSFGGLADEYAYTTQTWPGGEPGQPNVTASSSGSKWSRWLGYYESGVGTIGAYEGAMYYTNGLYRPSDNSKMRALGTPFDTVGREQLILRMYSYVRPLDGWFNGALTDPASLWVDAVDATITHVDWYVDGDLVAGNGGESFRLQDHGFGVGQYSVQAHAYDATGWVRLTSNLPGQDVAWSVTLTPEPGMLALLALGGLALMRRRRRV